MRRITKYSSISVPIANAFAYIAIELCKRLEGVKFAYVHDDYIYLLCAGELSYDGNIQNLSSACSSIASSAFNAFLYTIINSEYIEDCIGNKHYYPSLEEKEMCELQLFASVFTTNVYPVPQHKINEIFTYLSEQCEERVKARFFHRPFGSQLNEKETFWRLLSEPYRKGFCVCKQAKEWKPTSVLAYLASKNTTM